MSERASQAAAPTARAKSGIARSAAESIAGIQCAKNGGRSVPSSKPAAVAISP